MDGLGVSQEVTGAGAALAGLILVYLGMTVSSFDSYQPQEKKAVRARMKKRAWFAFGGLALALSATALMTLGKWVKSEGFANVAVFVLLVAFAWTVVTAVMAVWEIK